MALTIPEGWRKTQGQVYHNGRVLVAPDGEVLEVLVASRPIFKETGWEPLEREKRAKGTPTQDAGEKARRRATRALYLCARCNSDLDVFFTLTLDPEKTDRYDYKTNVRKLGQWLDNRCRRRGLKYLAVPEHHQDGAIHFHGLANSTALRLVDSGHRDKRGRTVYNIADWAIGFSTATYLSSHEAAAAYCSKYITKAVQAGTIGGRYWYHGGALASPRVLLFDGRPSPDAKKVEIQEAGLTLWYGGAPDGMEALRSDSGSDPGRYAVGRYDLEGFKEVLL